MTKNETPQQRQLTPAEIKAIKAKGPVSTQGRLAGLPESRLQACVSGTGKLTESQVADVLALSVKQVTESAKETKAARDKAARESNRRVIQTKKAAEVSPAPPVPPKVKAVAKPKPLPVVAHPAQNTDSKPYQEIEADELPQRNGEPPMAFAISKLDAIIAKLKLELEVIERLRWDWAHEAQP